MSYRSDLDALEARHAALEADVAHRTRELEGTRQLLEDARARVRLPVLDNIKVAAPCAAEWSKMTGDDRVRHCGDCDKRVYNLSSMTRDEAQALLVEHEGRLCVRYYKRHDGTILTADCPVGTRRRRRARWFAAGFAAMLAGGVLGAASRKRANVEMGKFQMGEPTATMGQMIAEPAPAPPPPEAVMGEVALPEPPK